MSTVLVKDDDAAAVSAAQALIEEAQRHKRRRRLRRAAVTLAVAGALAVGILFAVSSGNPAANGSGGRHGSTPLAATVRGTVRGRFVGIGTPLNAGPTYTIGGSGTVRLVAERGGKTFTAKAINGRWRITVPAGAYEIEGQGTTHLNHHWRVAPSSFVRVKAGQTQSIAVVIYGTTG